MEFVKFDGGRSPAEKEQAEHAFRSVMNSPGTPIVTAMAYSHYVLTDEWDEDLRHFKTVVEETHDLHDREAK